jgi:RNA polymerase sigma factor (TIGR02999 family)
LYNCANMSEVSRILDRIQEGEPSAPRDLLPLVYDELRKLAAAKLAQENPGQTLQLTALVHDAYVRLVDQDRAQKWDHRGHFFAAAATAMRRILIGRARRKRRIVHGRSRQRVALAPDLIAAPEADGELLALDAALTNLAEHDPLKARLVEVRYFAGMTGDQAAEILSISPSTADRDWAYARAWLRREMQALMAN